MSRNKSKKLKLQIGSIILLKESRCKDIRHSENRKRRKYLEWWNLSKSINKLMNQQRILFLSLRHHMTHQTIFQLYH